MNDFTNTTETSVSRKFAVVANALFTHPSVDHGADIGFWDADMTIPADFSGTLSHGGYAISLSLYYHINQDHDEQLNIEQEIDLGQASILIHYLNGCEQVGFGHNHGGAKLYATYDGTRLLQIAAEVNGETFTFARDLTHQAGIAPIFLPC